jgi:hypothetical protein
MRRKEARWGDAFQATPGSLSLRPLVPGILTVAGYRRHLSQCKSKRVGDTEKFPVPTIFRLALAMGWE